MTTAARTVYLTKAERVVLIEMARGGTNDEVGARVGISGHTVKSHLGRIARRFSTRGTTHMVALAIARGLIPAGSAAPATAVPVNSVALSDERLAEIVTLRDTYGESTDISVAVAHAALDDMLTAYEQLGSPVQLARWPHDDGACPLTHAQLETLTAAASGETMQAEADRTGGTLKRVHHRRDTARRALNVASIAHAVAIATACGWITPSTIAMPAERATASVREA